jgi:hypothetical protein
MTPPRAGARDTAALGKNAYAKAVVLKLSF